MTIIQPLMTIDGQVMCRTCHQPLVDAEIAHADDCYWIRDIREGLTPR